MFRDYPFGVGAGNFPAAIGQYLPQHAKRDAHNSYVLCYSELGIQGIALYILLLLGAWRMNWRIHTESESLPHQIRRKLRWANLGIAYSLLVASLASMTISRLYTEAHWWLLAMPVCLVRVLEDLRQDRAAAGPPQSQAGETTRE